MPKVKVNLPPMPRLPKEPDPRMLRTFGERPSFENLTPPDPSAPPIPSPSPSAYRRENPDNPPPADYKPPSMLVEHKRLAILFAAVCVAFVWYCWKTPQKPSALHTAVLTTPAARPQGGQPNQPIYVDTVPEK
jgi:hypothetical protein